MFPIDYDTPEAAAVASSGATLRVPDPERGDRFNLKLTPLAGKHELLSIASPASIRNALQAIGQIAISRATQRGTPLAGDESFF